MTDQHAANAAEPAGFLDRHHFLLRRLHSLSGIVPVGLFVCFHLFTNAQMLLGADNFQHEVNFIHSMPALLFMEITIWVSIGFHAALGVVYTVQGKSNVRHYRYQGNWRYTLQRTTGIIALIFIFLHIATLRWQWTFGGLFETFYVATAAGHPLATATTARALANNWVLAIYIIGVLSVVYHWSNGLWTAAITWGLTISPGAQKRWGVACAGLGVALTVFTFAAIAGARSYDWRADMAQLKQADEQGGGHHGELKHDAAVLPQSQPTQTNQDENDSSNHD